MKARINNKTWDSLSPAEQRRIMTLLHDQEDKDVMIVLDIFLKMSCGVLHDAFGFGERRCTNYLGNFRRVFRHAKRAVKDGSQLPELEAKMRNIFRKNGYPDDIFKLMFENWQSSAELLAEKEKANEITNNTKTES